MEVVCAVELEVGCAVGLEVGLAVELEVGFPVELQVGFVAEPDVDVEVVFGVVCPMRCNTAIKQTTTVAIAIRFIAGFPLDYLTVMCRPKRAFGADRCCGRFEAIPIGPSATESTTLRGQL